MRQRPDALLIDKMNRVSAQLGTKTTYSPTDSNRPSATHRALSQPRHHHAAHSSGASKSLDSPLLACPPSRPSPSTDAKSTLALLAYAQLEDRLFTRTASRHRAGGLWNFLRRTKATYTGRLMLLENLLHEQPNLETRDRSVINDVYGAVQHDFGAVFENLLQTILLANSHAPESSSRQGRKQLARVSDDLDGLVKTMRYNFPEHSHDILKRAKHASQALFDVALEQTGQAHKGSRKRLEALTDQLGALTYRLSIKVALPA